MTPALADFSPQIVFHLAGRTQANSAQDYYAANVIPAAQLLDGLEGLAERPVVVLMGSAAEYGSVSEADLPASEDQVCQPITDYGASKHAQTMLGLSRAARGWPIVIARLFNPVGPGMPNHLALGGFAERLAANPEILEVGDLDVWRDFISVDEAARLVIELALVPEAIGQVVNICSGRAFLLRALAERMVALTGGTAILSPMTSRMRPRDMTKFVGCTQRLRSLGLSPAEPDFDRLLPLLLEAKR
jgi:GDP-4-dehydro-6-deoxy-D-mannose reductase